MTGKSTENVSKKGIVQKILLLYDLYYLANDNDYATNRRQEEVIPNI